MPVTVAQALRAALALSGCTRRELALRAAITQSRLERILGGYDAPDRDETSALLRACGLQQALATARSPYRAFALLLHQQEKSQQNDIDDSECQLSIDKLTITFNTSRPRELIALASSVGRRVSLKKRPATRPEWIAYRDSFRCGSVLVQHGAATAHGQPKRRTSRLELNPAAATSHDFETAASVLLLARSQSTRISRLDVAVDLPISLRDVQVLASKRRKVNLFVGTSGVETIYLGVQGSELQYRVYDKRQELIDHGRADESHPEVTRFEAQLRNLGCEVGELTEIHDPFRRLRLVDLSGTRQLPFSRRLLVKFASGFGLLPLRQYLSAADFEVLVRDVETAATRRVPHPSEVFACRWPSLASKLVRALVAS